MIKISFETIVVRANKGLYGDLQIVRPDNSILCGPIGKVFCDKNALIIITKWTAWRLLPNGRWIDDPEVDFIITEECIPHFDTVGRVSFAVPYVGHITLLVLSDGLLGREAVRHPKKIAELARLLHKTRHIPFRTKIAPRF